MLEAGQKAPDFRLHDQDGKEVSLAGCAGKTVVLYFYPKDDTPGCTKEACAFRDSFADIQSTGALLYGVSADDQASHTKFREKHSLPFPLLSDPGAELARAFGAWGVKKMYGKEYEGIIRSTFVIGPDGVIQKVFPKVKPEEHAGEVLEVLR